MTIKEKQKWKNAGLYLHLLEKANDEKVLEYKLEVANSLYNIDLLIFKIKLIISFIGMIVTALLLFFSLLDFIIDPDYYYFEEVLVTIVFFMLAFFIFYRLYKKFMDELHYLREMILD